ncbi:hypothetical protein [Maribacter sp. 2307ULW6-5]|uniref:hypothetical protein n=1 Tax=Maribacter sp. 2307ULW6-5 TaxID=3386275 RepID=UPI0039BC4C67
MIQIKDAAHFFTLQKKLKRIPYSQSEGWYRSQIKKNHKIVFFVNDEEDVKIALWGKEQKIPFSNKKLLLVNGETTSEHINENEVREFYTKLTALNYVGFELDSNNRYDVEFEIGIRRAGFVRPIGSFSCPLTIIFRLQEDFGFNRNWKRNVKKAIASELIFEEVVDISATVITSIVSMFKEMAELKKLGHQLEEHSLKALLKTRDMRLFMVYDKQGLPLAARVIHINKPFASDVYAANSLTARDNGATYYMMQNIFETLKQENYAEFDFSRIPPSNHATDSVYLFKNASRGEKISYNGEWSYHKSKRIELLLFLYKSFKMKKQRY